MRILLVEDDRKTASFIKRGLMEEHFTVDATSDGMEAGYLAEETEYDLIILDVMLPGMDGMSVCKSLRDKKVNAPVLMLTAKGSVKDRVLGLDSGADDYLTKPFAFEELLARVRALLRRKSYNKSTTIRIADIELDQVKHKVVRAGKEIELSNKEYCLLEYLMLNANQIVTRTMLYEHVWDVNYDTFTNIVDVYINYLRKKVDKGFSRQLIHSVRGVGYILKG
jgi:heavy metal response regulator